MPIRMRPPPLLIGINFLINMNGYELSRNWFDWCFENPEKINPNHSALYFFAIEHCNRLGWRKKFGFPTEMAKDAIGIKSYGTYIKTLNDLVSFGFIEMIEKSKNQYSSNIIALSNFDKALDKALDKAIQTHVLKQPESICSIDKQLNNITNKQENTIELRSSAFKDSLRPFKNIYPVEMLKSFFDYWTEPNKSKSKMRFEMEKTWSLDLRLKTWANRQKDFAPKQTIKQDRL